MGEENDQLYYYHGDHLGSAQIVTDPEGEIYEQLEYTPYGELWVEHLKTTIETTPFRFTGKERDSETGLYYFGARYLNPQTGMWLSADPAMGEYVPSPGTKMSDLPGMGGIYNTINFHTYHYAGNNPIKYTDPDGEIVVLALAAIPVGDWVVGVLIGVVMVGIMTMPNVYQQSTQSRQTQSVQNQQTARSQQAQPMQVGPGQNAVYSPDSLRRSGQNNVNTDNNQHRTTYPGLSFRG